MMRRLLKNSAFPFVFQLGMTMVLAVVLYFLIYGPQTDEYNPGSYMLWYLWWASLPLIFLVVGRMWCAVCPIGFLTDIARRLFPKRPFKWPQFLVTYEISLIAGSLLTVHFLNLWFNFEENIQAGWLLLVLMIGLASLLAVFFQKRIWCRTLCPLGGFAMMMSGLSLLRLQVNKTFCVKRCSGSVCGGSEKSSESCPMAIKILQGIDPRFCSLCGKCIKDCSRNSIDVRWRLWPEPFKHRSPQFSLATLLFLGMALDICFYHLTDRPIYFWQLSQSLEITPARWFEMLFHVFIVALPSGLLALYARLGSRSASGYRDVFIDFARPALPLAALVVAAITLRSLIIAGPMNLKTILLDTGYQQFSWLDQVRFLDGSPLEFIEHVFVAIGIILALRELRRMFTVKTCQEKKSWEWQVSAVVAGITYVAFGAACFWMFHQSMLV